MNTPAKPTPRFGFYLAATLLIAGTFLGPDLMRRYLDYFEGHGPVTILANAGVVGLLTTLICMVLAATLAPVEKLATRAAALLGLRRYRADLTLFLLYFLFYSAWVHFGKQLLDVWFEPLDLPTRQWLLGGLAAAGALLYLPARPWLQRVVDAPEEPFRDFRQGVFLLVGLTLLGIPADAVLGRQPEPPRDLKRPDVFLISLDTLAARHMSLYGYSRPTTPNLERLAKDGQAFQWFHAQSNTTSTSLKALQGYYPGPLPGPSLTQVLEQNGYRTEFVSFWGPKFLGVPAAPRSTLIRAFQGSPLHRALAHLLPRRQLVWMDALGTEEFPYFNPYDARIEDEYHRFFTKQHAPASLALDYVLDEMDGPPGGRMFWIHLWEPHYPYLPAADLAGKFGGGSLSKTHPLANAIYAPWVQPQVDEVRNLYDEQILSVDRDLGRFFDELRRRGLYDRSLVAVTSDHGESFAGGYVGHGGPFLSEALLHIPLIVKLPGGPAPSRPLTFSDMVDVAPTLLTFLGLQLPKAMPGECLLPYMADPQKLSSRPRWAVSFHAFNEEPGEIAVYWKRYKLIYWRGEPGRHVLYDLREDPLETRDIAAQHRDLVQKMLQVVSF